MAYIPYAKPAYDNSQSAARMSDLIRARGVAAANAERQQGAASAYMWGSMIDTAGRTMSDLIKYKAGEKARALDEAKTNRLLREEDRAKLLDTLSVTTRGLPLEAKAKVYSEHGFEAEAKAMGAAAQEAAQRSNKSQVGSLIGVYGADDPDEVMRQGMSVEPEMTSRFLKDRADAEDKAFDRQLKQLTALPLAQKETEKVWATPVVDQDDLNARLETTKRIATMVGQPGLVSAVSPTFDPQATEEQRKKILEWVHTEAKGAVDKFTVFYAGWTAEHGAPKTAKASSDLLKAFQATQPKDEAGAAGGKPASTAQRADALRWKGTRTKELEEAFEEANLAANPKYVRGKTAPSQAALEELESGKLKVENSYREMLGLPPVASLEEVGYGPSAGGKKTMSALAQPAPVAAPPATTTSAPTATTPTATTPASAGAAPTRYGPAMTEKRAVEILTAQTGRPPSPEDIRWFLSKYPYEVVR